MCGCDYTARLGQRSDL